MLTKADFMFSYQVKLYSSYGLAKQVFYHQPLAGVYSAGLLQSLMLWGQAVTAVQSSQLLWAAPLHTDTLRGGFSRIAHMMTLWPFVFTRFPRTWSFYRQVLDVGHVNQLKWRLTGCSETCTYGQVEVWPVLYLYVKDRKICLILSRCTC